MDSHYIDASGIKTHYLEAGQGKPIILMHGGGAGADAWSNWRGCIPTFARHFRVLAIDMLGFGKTDKPDPASFVYSQDARSKHLANFIEAMDLQKVSLVGNSMGGATSLGVCMQRPELVDKLVLMGSAGLNAEISEALRVILSYAPSRENMQQLVRVLTHDEFQPDPEVLEYRYNLTQQPGVMAAYGATMKWVAQQGGLFYPEEAIQQVKHNTLIVNGKQDKIVPPELGWKFSQLLENSRLYLIPHCGHWAMVEHPQEFCDMVTWFLLHA